MYSDSTKRIFWTVNMSNVLTSHFLWSQFFILGFKSMIPIFVEAPFYNQKRVIFAF